MKTIWFFLLFLGFYSNKIALGTEIRCFVEYTDHRQKCIISEIEKEGIKQRIYLPISLNDTQTIPFSENTLDSILSNLFKAIPELPVLEIDSPKSPLNLENAMTDAEAIEWMRTLEHNLEETSSKEMNVKPINFGALTNNLSSLTIHAPLGTIPKQIFSSANSLELVYFFKCNITKIEDFAFANGKQWSELHLNRNSITEIRQNTFAGLSNLKVLNLNFNEISHIEDGVLNLPKLISLNLKGNQLTTLSDTVFNQLPNLKFIQFSWNKLEHIGESLYSLQKLINVHLYHNQIVDIDLKKFAKLPTLNRLHLEKSGFDWTTQADVTDDFITSANSNLNWLDVSYNNITDSSFINKLKMFRKLENLVIDGNPFEELTWTASSVHEVFPSLRKIFVNDVKLNCEHRENLRKKFEIGNITFHYLSSDCTA